MVGNFNVGCREAEFAPAPVAVDDFARVSEISAEQLIGRIQIARRNQRANPRAADDFSVDGERLTNLSFESETFSLAQEQTPVASAETPESVIRTGDDVRGRNFFLEEFQKFFGGFAAEIFGERNFDEHVDAHVGKNFAAQIFAANHERRVFGGDDGQRVVGKGKDAGGAVDLPRDVDCVTDDARVPEVNSVEHAERDDRLRIFFGQAYNFFYNLQRSTSDGRNYI